MPSFEPHGEPVTSRRGFFWVGAEKVDGPFGTVVRAPMFVEWEAPPEVTRPYPIVLVHGGGGQGLDWMGTADGRPGWSRMLVDRGYAVYVVDRPCHGRSSYHPNVVGPMGAPFPFQAGSTRMSGDCAAQALRRSSVQVSRRVRPVRTSVIAPARTCEQGRADSLVGCESQ